VRKAFAQIGEQVQGVDEGVLKVAGLGRFRIRQIDEAKDGAKRTVKRMMFKPESSK
jgi:hypothetical protein